MFVIVSYTPDYELRCPRGCCSDGSGSSRFGMFAVGTIAEAAEYIAGVINLDEHAENQFLVFDRWETVLGCAQFYSESLAKDEQSVRMCGHYLDDYDEEVRLDKLEQNLRFAVRDRLTKLRSQAKIEADEKKRKQEEIDKAKLLEAKRQQLERLKKELGE